MIILIRIIILTVVILLLSACSTHKAEPSTSTPNISEQTDSQVRIETSPHVPETPNSAHDYIVDIRVSTILEEGCTVIAEDDNGFNENLTYVYIYTDRPVYDILISAISEFVNNEPIEREGILYVSELSPGQTIKLSDPYPILNDSENLLTQIAYTNNKDNYEVVVLHGDEAAENPSLSPADYNLSGKRYDEFYLENEQSENSNFFSAEFNNKALAGDFDDCIPKGFSIAGGTLGDVNGDGLEDALMYLISDNRRAAAYVGVMPLFILTGQAKGGYVIEKKIANALFTPYRSSSYPSAGNGYVDIIYNYVGGARCHHTQVCRFLYDHNKNGWFLGMLSYQPTFPLDYSEELSPVFVHPLPLMYNLPIEKLTGTEFHNSPPDWYYFDEVFEFSIPSFGENYETYTLAVKLDKTAGYYEGYIYHYYKSLDSGGFIQTIRGEYKSGTKLDVIANTDDKTFNIQNDIWKLDEYDSDSFILTS